MSEQADLYEMVMRGIFWDLNGTLTRSEDASFIGWSKVIAERGLAPLPREDYDAIAGMPRMQIAQSIQARYGLREKPQALDEEKDHYVVEAFDAGLTMEPVPGAISLLRAYQRLGLRMGVITGGTIEETRRKLHASGLERYLGECIVTRDEVGQGKPDPALYQLGLRRLGLRPHEVVAFEDSGHGVKAALAAGIEWVVAIPTDYTKHQDFRGAMIVPSLSYLVKLGELIARKE